MSQQIHLGTAASIFAAACALVLALPQSPLIAETDDRPTLAVVQFQGRGKVDSFEAAIITELIEARVQKGGQFKVVSREKVMEALMKEQATQQTGLIDPRKLASMGKFLQADKIMTGTVGSLMADFLITAKIVDVQTGLVEFSENTEPVPSSGLAKASSALVENLTEQILTKLESQHVHKYGHRPDTLALRSALLPGWGQWTSGSHTIDPGDDRNPAAYGFFGGFAGLAVLEIGAVLRYNKLQRDYSDRTVPTILAYLGGSDPRNTGLLANVVIFQSKRAGLKNQATRVNAIGFGLLALYGLNIYDAYANAPYTFKPGKETSSGASPPGFSVRMVLLPDGNRRSVSTAIQLEVAL